MNAIDNAGKHLIEITSYGSAYYRGVVVKETEQTFSVNYPGDKRSRRVFKGKHDVLLDASADADAALRRFRTAYASFDAEMNAAQAAVRHVEARRRAATVAALAATTSEPSP